MQPHVPTTDVGRKSGDFVRPLYLRKKILRMRGVPCDGTSKALNHAPAVVLRW